MSFRTIIRTAVLGATLAAAVPALADDAVSDYLDEPGQGVVENIGNSRAADQHLFDVGERPRAHLIYDADRGVYVEREAPAQQPLATHADAPQIDFGIDIL